MYVTLSDLKKCIFPLEPGDRIFLYGVPGAGKTTFAQELIRSYFHDSTLTVVSPTYTYYQKYGTHLYHFDLYRAETLADITRIGADEVLDDPESICIIEWPEIVEKNVTPTKSVFINVEKEGRDFCITKKPE